VKISGDVVKNTKDILYDPSIKKDMQKLQTRVRSIAKKSIILNDKLKAEKTR